MQTSPPMFNRSFLSLLSTQFLGAANDNILKQLLVFMVATGIWSGSLTEGGLGEGGQAIPALCLTLPFILLSGYAGQLADRYSKRSLMLTVKVAELPIAVVALIGLVSQNLWLTLAALLLLAIQSSFFGPAKFGVIPEIVGEHRLSQANGTLNMFSNLAVIVGSLAAGPLSVMFDPKPGNSFGIAEPIRWAPGVALVAIAVAGLVSIWTMPRVPASNPILKVKFDFLKTYWHSIKEMTRPLLTVTLAWSGFYMVGMMALMILPEYEHLLHIDYVKTSLLIGALGVSVAAGSVGAGFISGGRIRPELVPVGALGMATSFVLLGAMTPSYATVAVLISLAGVFAGLYIVPLQALLQYLAPADQRGRFLGTANALSFLACSVGAVLYWGLTSPLALAPNRVYLFCGGLAAAGTSIGILQVKRILPCAEHV